MELDDISQHFNQLVRRNRRYPGIHDVLNQNWIGMSEYIKYITVAIHDVNAMHGTYRRSKVRGRIANRLPHRYLLNRTGGNKLPEQYVMCMYIEGGPRVPWVFRVFGVPSTPGYTRVSTTDYTQYSRVPRVSTAKMVSGLDQLLEVRVTVGASST